MRVELMPRIFIVLLSLFACCVSIPTQAERPATANLWPAKPPGETKELPPEADTTKPDANLVAGRRVIRLGNVSTPTMTVYRPKAEIDTGAAVIVCPGGGHHILAYDLEGTEVAEWLTSIGVTGVVLKYRVPAREPEKRWRAAVQDAQRAMSLLRSQADDWGIDPARIGICGFSAGGEAAALTALFGNDRTYDPIDKTDEVSCRPDFAILVYPAYLAEKDESKLREYIHVTEDTPPMFFAHAADDRVTPLSSILLFTELKKAGVGGELHVYSTGGHGYGLRKTDLPVTHWPERCEQWMRASGLIK
ncbi:MAG: alpha/beta hydrolase [Planctomycetes bacterium]|nr:alpha/beta hydrolase [Planctomycetota bacterium]